MSNDLVGFSRAGDVFHYRWAARRCLKMIYPNSMLKSLIVEGSKEQEKAGEFVIDLTECYTTIGDNEKISYYQLKHTTVLKDKPFILSDLKKTIEGFSLRFEQHYDKKEVETKGINFTIVTNRKIDDNFKKNLINICEEKSVNKSFKTTLEKYTNLTGVKLKEFCCLLILEDSEGDYQVQKEELRVEMHQLISGSFDNNYVDSITSLIQEKVLPDSDGKVVKEEILRCFKITSERDLYPAEAIWEELDKTIIRVQHNELRDKILLSSNPLIIHAEGGVGKSVFARQLVNSLPEGSIGIAYDCFGAGGYRNRSTTRHMHRTALVQIVNELSTKGLCDPLLAPNTTLDGDIMRDFLNRINSATKALQKSKKSASLVIVIDAADNAEMAANEFNESCFAHQLIREKLPTGCKIVFLCRTERIDLLRPISLNDRFELAGFNKDESLENLKKYFPDAQVQDGLEFHRLTNGNPRVQANALDFKTTSVSELLESLGPAGSTVENQIELQLNRAVDKIKDLLPIEFQDQIGSLCLGLASLSPHIPIDILAKAANVDVNTVRSFVSDIGRPLWISDLSVQFRDEPTETWFRKKFCASKEDFQKYIGALEPLAINSTYVAQVLPQLYLLGEQYDKLISSALSDDFLPKDNPIDARNVRVYRLQFAFKAALKLSRFKDAIKVAVRAGEEIAGDQRQLLLLRQNLDLLVALQDKDKVKEIAFKRRLSGTWDGSENVYSSALLSSIDDYKGEARGYLRAAMNWLNIYFDQPKEEDDYDNHNRLEDADILELAYAHLNINGNEGCSRFLLSLKPSSVVYRVVKKLTERLVDQGNFDVIDALLISLSKDSYYVIAITSELVKVGRFPEKKNIEKCLKTLSNKRTSIKVGNQYHEDTIIHSIISFLETCLYRKLSNESILKALNFYIPDQASQMVYNSHFGNDREIFLRALVIRSIISGSTEINIEAILPNNLKNEDKKHKNLDDIKEFKYVINGLFPWYFAKMHILINQPKNLNVIVNDASQKSKTALQGRYKNHDLFPSEIASVCSSILIISINSSPTEIKEFYDRYISNNARLTINAHLAAVRYAYRLPHLLHIKRDLEINVYKLLKSKNDDGPDEIANRYISLSRAVLVDSIDDASVYFEDAISIVSKFGDEIYQRWESIIALTKQFAKSSISNDEIAYRFIRIAELVGDNLREKHWDRGEAIQLCTRMSTSMGLSVLSRWREREVGRFEWLNCALILELVDSNKISIPVAISLTAYLNIDQNREFVVRCLKKPISKEDKNLVITELIQRFKTEGISIDFWKRLKDISDNENLSNLELDEITKSIKDSIPVKEPTYLKERDADKSIKFNWNQVFFKSDVNNKIELFESLSRFDKKISERNPFLPKREFWKKVIEKISENKMYDFFQTLLEVDSITKYDVEEVFKVIPAEWRLKASFRKKFPDILRLFGENFAHELTIPYNFKSFKESLELDSLQVRDLQEGIFNGLASGNEFANAEVFFGFVTIASPLVNNSESKELLDFSFSRFELHIPDDYGDGLYGDAVCATNDINNSIAGFIWSSLGAPKSSIRWKAVHCVRKLAKYDCLDIINQLFFWLQHKNVGAFGVKSYPFYSFHARQYLLITFARVSIDKPEILKRNATVFSQYALDEKHILIQKFAADIALNIEKAYPRIYTLEELALLKNVVKTKHPARNLEYGFSIDSYLHAKGEVNPDIDFHFGWDFDNYWFKPLGEVFGISSRQVEDLATITVQETWGNIEGGYYKDPRVELWNSSINEISTQHSHGSYPRTDRLDFYISYHAMMIVAANLLENMPTVSRKDWGDWISRHLLTRPDGYWLSDFRDPVPIVRPSWIEQENRDNKQLEIVSTEFLDSLLIEQNNELWLNVYGGWQEQNSFLRGTYHVSSALVSPKTSQALLNALSTCEDFRDFKLPAYKERHMEINDTPFALNGWIKEQYISKELDEYDPFAGEIEYPPYVIGNNVVKKLNLTVSEDGKKWYSPLSTHPSIINQLYTSYIESRNDAEPAQSGNRLMCSLPFLKYLCSKLNSELVIEIQIGRDFIHRYSSEDRKYRESLNKIFILSSDGKIRSTEESAQLG